MEKLVKAENSSDVDAAKTDILNVKDNINLNNTLSFNTIDEYLELCDYYDDVEVRPLVKSENKKSEKNILDILENIHNYYYEHLVTKDIYDTCTNNKKNIDLVELANDLYFLPDYVIKGIKKYDDFYDETFELCKQDYKDLYKKLKKDIKKNSYFHKINCIKEINKLYESKIFTNEMNKILLRLINSEVYDGN